MLVLSRRKAERIQIGSDIWITIVSVRGERVRVGIDAPSDVTISRPEVAEKLVRKEKDSANVS